MARQAIELAKALVLELRALLPNETIERRYCPRMDREELIEKRIIAVYWESAERSGIMRGTFASNKNTFGIAIQQAAKGTPGAIDGIDDLVLGDSIVELADQIASYWQPQGALHRKLITNCNCETEPTIDLPDPFIIAKYGIFSAIVGVTYQATGD